MVHLDLESPLDDLSDVDAFSTDTRDLDPAEMAALIRKIASLLSDFGPHVVFKKIDSVMRGNPGREIIAAMGAFGCDLAVITPAFPDMGRSVRQGHLHVHGDSSWQPLNVLTLLRNQGLEECTHIEPECINAAIRDGARYISLDATCNDHLKAIVEEALRSGRRILWAGSGGLASALAAALFSGAPAPNAGPAGSRPVLFCIGSDHPVTAAQVEALRKRRGACEFSADLTTPNELSAALSRGDHAILQISRDSTNCERLRVLLHDIGALTGAILLSGGDTASMVCRALSAHAIEIEDQIVTGLPSGVLIGGWLDGSRVATKSGGFGEVDALIQVADFFTCPKN